MGLNISCLQRIKDDETSSPTFNKPSDLLSFASAPPRRIRSIPPPPPRMRRAIHTRASTMDAIHNMEIHRNQSDNLNVSIQNLRVNINNINKNIHINTSPSDQQTVQSINTRVMTPSIPSIPTTPPPQKIDSNIFDSITIPKIGNNKSVIITTTPVIKKTQMSVNQDNIAMPPSNTTVKPYGVSNTLCVPNIPLANRAKSISVTHSNISALSSAASAISTLSPSHTHSRTRTASASSNSNHSSSGKSCDSNDRYTHEHDSSYSHSKSNASHSHSSQLSTSDNETDSSSTNNSLLTDDTLTDGIGGEFSPITPGSDDSNAMDDHDDGNQTTIVHDISTEDLDEEQEEEEHSIDTEEIHRKYDERIAAAHCHLTLQNISKRSNTMTASKMSQISQLSVAIPSSRYGTSYESNFSDSGSEHPCTIIVTPASPHKFGIGVGIGIGVVRCMEMKEMKEMKSPSSCQSAPVTPTSRKREDSRSSIWAQHPTEDELDELDSEDEFDRIDKEDSSMDKEDSYDTDDEDKVNEIEVTVNNRIYHSILPTASIDTCCCNEDEDSEDEAEEEDELASNNDEETNKRQRRRSSLLSTISALSRLTKHNKYHGMELIPQRLATANKLSSRKEEDKEDYMYIIYKDGDQKQKVKIIYEESPNILSEKDIIHNNTLSLTSVTQSIVHSVMTKETPSATKCESPFNDNLTIKSCKSPYGGSFVSRSMKSISTISLSPMPIEQEVLSAYSQSAVGSSHLDIDDITKYLQEDDIFSSYDPNNMNTEYVD